MLGNLARPSYLDSTEGIWPWSYDECGTTTEARNALQAQKINSCNSTHGRGSPEIDIIEAQPGDFILQYWDVPFTNGSSTDVTVGRPLISSSLQVAPGVHHALRPETPDLPEPGEWYPDLFPISSSTYGSSGYSRMLNNYWYGQVIARKTLKSGKMVCRSTGNTPRTFTFNRRFFAWSGKLGKRTATLDGIMEKI